MIGGVARACPAHRSESASGGLEAIAGRSSTSALDRCLVLCLGKVWRSGAKEDDADLTPAAAFVAADVGMGLATTLGHERRRREKPCLSALRNPSPRGESRNGVFQSQPVGRFRGARGLP